MMMNDLQDMIQVSCEESVTAADEARMEYDRGISEMLERERQENWQRLEAQHGPLMTSAEWRQHSFDYSEYLDMGWKD